MPAVAEQKWFDPLFTSITSIVVLAAVVAAIAAGMGAPLFELPSRGSFAGMPLFSSLLDVLDYFAAGTLKTIFYVNCLIAACAGLHFKLTRKRRPKRAAGSQPSTSTGENFHHPEAD